MSGARRFLAELGPVLRQAVFAWRALEGVVDDGLGQDADLDVAGLGGPGQEGECLVSVDVVPLHEDADRGADVGAGVERLAELFDLFGVSEQGSGLGGEELGDLYRGAVERPRR